MNTPEQPLIIPVQDTKEDEYLYRVYRECYFYFTIDDIEYRGLIPEGFESDGTSVPFLLQPIIKVARDGLERAASWPHDYLYKNKGNIPVYTTKGKKWVKINRSFTRAECDYILYRILQQTKGISDKRADVIYAGVRIAGWIHWSHEKDKYLKFNSFTPVDLTAQDFQHYLGIIHNYTISQCE